jgi:hypothetical protein
LAVLVLSRGDWAGAQALRSEALVFGEKLRRQDLIAINCNTLAQSPVRQGKANDAVHHARRAVEIFTKLCMPELSAAQATLAECEACFACF